MSKIAHFSEFPYFQATSQILPHAPTRWTCTASRFSRIISSLNPYFYECPDKYSLEITSCTGKTISLNTLSDTYRFIQAIQIISICKVSKESYTDLGHQGRKGFWEPIQQIIINKTSIFTYELKKKVSILLAFHLNCFLFSVTYFLCVLEDFPQVKHFILTEKYSHHSRFWRL